MPKFVLKRESHYRVYGAIYPETIGEVHADRTDDAGNVVRFVYDGDENPDPLHFEELAEPAKPAPRPAVPTPPTPAVTATEESD